MGLLLSVINFEILNILPLFLFSFPAVGENGLSDSSHYCQVSLLRAGWEVVVVVEPIRVGAGL